MSTLFLLVALDTQMASARRSESVITILRVKKRYPGKEIAETLTVRTLR